MSYIVFAAISGTFLWIVVYYIQKKKIEHARLEQEREDREYRKFLDTRIQYQHDHNLYALNTHSIKLKLFDADNELGVLSQLYQKVVIDNYWLNEPFHSYFYKLMLMVASNDFMILDKKSKVITMSIRDKNGDVQVSHAYSVFSTQEVILLSLNRCNTILVNKSKHQAQKSILAAIIFVLEHSTYYLDKKIVEDQVQEFLNLCEFSSDIENVLEGIETKNGQYWYIEEAFNDAMINLPTYPYNDSESVKKIRIPYSLPQKSLRLI